MSTTGGESSKNYFELFEFPVSFAINSAELKRRYHDLQHSIHPDRFATSEVEQQWAVYYASRINDAYQTLKAPLKRAVYLLKHYGVSIELEKETINDPLFLQEQMNFREQLATQPDVEQLRQTVQERIAQSEQALQELFEQQEKDFQRIKLKIMQLRFFNKLKQEINEQVNAS